MMGKIFKVLVAFMLILTMISMCGCEQNTSDEENIPTTEELLASQYDELLTAFPESTDPEDIISYVHEWAEKQEITELVYDNDILVLQIKASKNRSEDKSEVLQCTVSGENIETELQSLASLMYTITHLSAHGPVTAVINSESAKSKISSYIEDADSFINLHYSESSEVINSAAASAEYEITNSLEWRKPRFSKAYKVSIKNLNGGNITDLSEGHPNPILQLNSLLAKWNTSGYLYDLASFKGGSKADSYCKSATMVVVLPDSDAERFQSRVEKQQAKFEKKYADSEENYEFTIEEVKVPKKVLSTESETALVSLLYTMIAGEYLTDENSEELIAYSNIGKLRIKDATATLKMQIYSRDKDVFKEMKEAVNTLSEISGFKASKKTSYGIWEETDDSPLLRDMLSYDGFKPELKPTYGNNECSLVHKVNKKAECVSVGLSFDNWSDTVEMLITTLKNEKN